MAAASEYKVFGAGNPLLDISCVVDQAFYDKWELKPSNAILAEKDKHEPLYPELEAMDNVQYIPGGSTLNSIRVSNWILGDSGSVAYIGSVAKDATGDRLGNIVGEEGVATAWYKDGDCPQTGRCAVCILGKERSMVADLSAANSYVIQHLDSDEARALWQNSKICYSAGFWLTVCPEGMCKIANYCKENGRDYCLNISAPFLAQFFLTQMQSVLPNTTILFGNEDEAKALGKSLNQPESATIQELAVYFSTYLREDSPRRVVITQGAEPVIVAQGTEVREYPVDRIDPNLIVDTNGAGDAFVGGFLAALANDEPEETCVKQGNYCAGFLIQQSGCTFGGQSPAFN